MRFLIDASLSPIVAATLNEAGHDAVHVGDVLALDALDAAVFEHAAAENRTIVAADTDFGELLALRASRHPSLVLLHRRSHRRPSEQARLLLAHLADIEHDLEDGAVVVVEQARLRIRPLPIDPA